MRASSPPPKQGSRDLRVKMVRREGRIMEGGGERINRLRITNINLKRGGGWREIKPGTKKGESESCW